MLRKQLRELIELVRESHKTDYGHQRVLDLLTKENRRQQETIRQQTLQINKLMDRLMAKDFESYASYKETEDDVELFSVGSKNEPLEDESNIGEVIE